MVTKTDILATHPQTSFLEKSDSTIYIADFTRRTQGTINPRSVEISTSLPTMDDGTAVDAVLFHNEKRLPIEIATFNDYIFENIAGNNIEHCEGGMYVKDVANWVAFFEIKDCDESNILKYKAKAIRQITNVSNDFKSRNIVTSKLVYGIISFPRRHTAFNDDIFGDMIEYTKLKRSTGILFYATNEVFIADMNELKPVVE